MGNTRLDGFHIFFNGPPQVGKTTLGLMLVEASSAEGVEFKKRLVEIILAMTAVTADQWDIWYAEGKEKIRPELFNYSCRGIQQVVAEKMIKPSLGLDFFGKAGVRDTELNKHGTVYLDGGFKEELDSILEVHRHDRVIVIQLSGNGGKSFVATTERGADTRYYLDPKDYPQVSFLSVVNDGQINTVYQIMEMQIERQMDVLRGAI
jgi:hypothetical protein